MAVTNGTFHAPEPALEFAHGHHHQKQVPLHAVRHDRGQVRLREVLLLLPGASGHPAVQRWSVLLPALPAGVRLQGFRLGSGPWLSRRPALAGTTCVLLAHAFGREGTTGGHDFSRAVKFCDRGFSPCGHSACDRVHSRQFPWTGIEFKSSVCRGVKIVFGSTHNFAFYRVLSNISNVYGVISCISNAMINVSAFPYFHVQSQLVLDPKGESPFDELQSSFQLDF